MGEVKRNGFWEGEGRKAERASLLQCFSHFSYVFHSNDKKNIFLLKKEEQICFRTWLRKGPRVDQIAKAVVSMNLLQKY